MPEKLSHPKRMTQTINRVFIVQEVVTKRTISQFGDLDTSYSFWVLLSCHQKLLACLMRVMTSRLSSCSSIFCLCLEQITICVLVRTLLAISPHRTDDVQKLSPLRICWVYLFFFFNLFTQNQISIVWCHRGCQIMNLLPVKPSTINHLAFQCLLCT